MKYGSLIMEKKDYVMILKNRIIGHSVEDYSHKDMLERLEEYMADAVVYDRADMPDDVIRLYSWATISSGSGWYKTFQVVLPFEKDINRDRISVQSALGASVVGRAEGEVVQFGTPIGVIPLKIEQVEQSGLYIRDYISTTTYKKYLSKRQRASLSNVNSELI